MVSKRKQSAYTSYMLRSWLEGNSWRYSLEEVGSGKRHGFATLDEFFSFMLARAMLPDDDRPCQSQTIEERGDRIITEEE